MHRVPNQNQWRKDLAEWRGVKWTLLMEVNGRMVVDHVTAVAVKEIGPDVKATGHAESKVDPFDDLRSVVVATLVEAAMNAVDTLLTPGQDPLPFSPHER